MKNFIEEKYLKDLQNKNIWIFCDWKICKNLISEINFFKYKIANIWVENISLELDNIIKIVEKNNLLNEKLLFIKENFPKLEDMINISKKDFFNQTKTNIEDIFWHINSYNLEKYSKFFKKDFFIFFKKLLDLIEEKKVKRIHIFTNYKKGFLAKELLTASWAEETILVSNNFWFTKQKASKKDIFFIEEYIKENPNIKPRSREYIEKNIDNFYILKIDDLSIGIFEIKKLWEEIIEIWALALSKRWQKRGLWKITNEFIINNFLDKNQIFVTPNEALAWILLNLNLKEINWKTWNIIIDKRFEKMLLDNKNDNKTRRFFILTK